MKGLNKVSLAYSGGLETRLNKDVQRAGGRERGGKNAHRSIWCMNGTQSLPLADHHSANNAKPDNARITWRTSLSVWYFRCTFALLHRHTHSAWYKAKGKIDSQISIGFWDYRNLTEFQDRIFLLISIEFLLIHLPRIGDLLNTLTQCHWPSLCRNGNPIRCHSTHKCLIDCRLITRAL